ncbi:MAG: hypothetical protein MJ109_01375 [Kiritimatiellae bacterium]|nr:hypothetical protein [Kiritimatiellia bacterium]
MNNELDEIDNGPYFEPGDNDPINGRFVNAQHKRLLIEQDWMGYRGEKNKEREEAIFKEEVEILKEESAKNNPLALFYMGVCCVNGSGMPKDSIKGRTMLERAYALGVKRAADFLLMYFGEEALQDKSIVEKVQKNIGRYRFKIDDVAEIVKKMIATEAEGTAKFKLAVEASNGIAKAFVGLYDCLKGDESKGDYEPTEDSYLCLCEAATLKDAGALCEIGEISLCYEKYRDIAYGVESLWEAHNLGDELAGIRLKNLWANDLKNYTDPEYRMKVRADGDDVYAVGFYYLHGICVERSVSKAKMYFEISHKMGCRNAREQLLLLDND